MTREEGKEFANALKNNYTIDFDKMPEFCDLVISALSESKGDLISRQAVLDYIDKMPSELTTDGRRMIRRRTLEEYISDTLPSVSNLENPNKGEWIFDETLDKHYYCSECKSMGVSYWDYCPYCGADMRGKAG